MNFTTLIEFTKFGQLFPLSNGRKTPMKNWRWKQQNSDDVQVLFEWSERFPDANWALIPTRCLVVDVDVKQGALGQQSIDAAGGLTETFTVMTPSGGSHHYFEFSDNGITSNSIIPGVDIRGNLDG